MALPISIEKLLDGSMVEGHRIEFKQGWNPAPVYRTICAFANDFTNDGGGYILIGVKEVNGLPVRPVQGIGIGDVESMEKKMVEYNNLISPVYFPKTSMEEIDGKLVYVIWCPAGLYRPYEVPDNGSPSAIFEFDEDRTWFMVTVPAHPVFLGDDPVNDPVNERIKNGVNDSEKPILLNDRQMEIYSMIEKNDRITKEELKKHFGVSLETIKRDIAKMKKEGILIRVGSDKNGCWLIARKVRR